MAPGRAQLRTVWGNSHFWVLLGLLALLTLFHYAEQIGVSGTAPPSLHFGLTRHAMDRGLFLGPIVYACIVFGFAGGLAACFLSLVIMLPRALFVSPAPADALLESGAVTLLGAVVCQIVTAVAKKRELYRRTLEELQIAHERLQHYVRIARSDEKRLSTLNALSAVLTQSLELKETLKAALNMIMDLLELEVALLCSLEEESQRLRLVAYEGVSEEFARAIDRVKVGEGFFGRVAQTGEPIAVVEESSDSGSASPAVREMKIQAQLVVPLALKDRVVGVLCVGNRRPRHFTTTEVDLLTAIANQIGFAIENARLLEKERHATQQALASQKKYQDLFENAVDAIWLHDLEGNILAANKATENLMGYTVEELTKMNVRSLLSRESLELAGRMRRRIFQGEPVEQPYTQRLIRKDGTEAILDLAANLITDNGRPVGFQCIARDVTEEKRLQDNLRLYLGQITKAQEEERKRIARELHDDTSQTLYGLSRQLDNFVRHSKNLPGEDATFLGELRRQLDAALESVRRFSQDLRPPMLDDLGLIPALRWLVGGMEGQYGVKAYLTIFGKERRLSAEAELILFRIVQEGLRNVGKHAQASRAEVVVEFGEGKTKVSITDNGRGFELSGKITDLARSGKLGLAGIEERARLLGGQLRFHSALGKGTRLEVEVPV